MNFSVSKLKKTISYCGGLVMLLVIMLPTAVGAFGVSPSGIFFKNVLPQNTIEHTIYISRADTSRAEYLNVVVSGSGSEAIVVSTKKITLPVGQTQVPLIITISPKTLAVGTYEPKIIFTPIKDGVTQDSINLNLSIAATVAFSVTNEPKKELKINFDGIHNNEKSTKNNQLLNLRAVNSGNQSQTITRAEFVWYEDKNSTEKRTQTVTLSEDFAPFSNRSFSIPFRGNFDRGIHRGDFKLYADAELVFEKNDLLVNKEYVAPILVDKKSKPDWLWSLPVIGTGLVLAAGMSAWLQRRYNLPIK